MFLYLHNYVQKSGFSERYFIQRLDDIDQVKLVYMLSLVVGLLSALAAAFLKNAIHYTHQILTRGITGESGSYLYLAYPVIRDVAYIIVCKIYCKG